MIIIDLIPIFTSPLPCRPPFDQTVNLRLVGFAPSPSWLAFKPRVFSLVWLRTAFSLGSLSSFYASKVSLLERSRDEIRVDDNQSGDKYLNCCDKYLNRLRAPALETRIARIWTYTSSLFFFFFVVSIYLFERSEWMVIIKSGDI